jgi:hypothetical protein
MGYDLIDVIRETVKEIRPLVDIKKIEEGVSPDGRTSWEVLLSDGSREIFVELLKAQEAI